MVNFELVAETLVGVGIRERSPGLRRVDFNMALVEVNWAVSFICRSGRDVPPERLYFGGSENYGVTLQTLENLFKLDMQI